MLGEQDGGGLLIVGKGLRIFGDWYEGCGLRLGCLQIFVQIRQGDIECLGQFEVGLEGAGDPSILDPAFAAFADRYRTWLRDVFDTFLIEKAHEREYDLDAPIEPKRLGDVLVEVTGPYQLTLPVTVEDAAGNRIGREQLGMLAAGLVDQALTPPPHECQTLRHAVRVFGAG